MEQAQRSIRWSLLSDWLGMPIGLTLRTAKLQLVPALEITQLPRTNTSGVSRWVTRNAQMAVFKLSPGFSQLDGNIDVRRLSRCAMAPEENENILSTCAFQDAQFSSFWGLRQHDEQSGSCIIRDLDQRHLRV